VKRTGAVRLLAFSLAAVGAGCKPADRKIADALRSSASWAATAEEAAAGWAKHEHPIPYTRDTLETARRELTSARRTIRKSAPDAPSAAPAATDELLGRIDGSIAAMVEAIDRADTAAVLARRSDLFELEKRVRAIAEGGTGR
jgi:hypothetical protein